MFEVIDYYFASVRPETPSVGQIWWLCYPNAHRGPEVRRVSKNPEKRILLDVTTFDPQRETEEPPDKTAANEFLGLTKFKLRPAVVLSAHAEPCSLGNWHGGSHYLVAPLHTLRDRVTNE